MATLSDQTLNGILIRAELGDKPKKNRGLGMIRRDAEHLNLYREVQITSGTKVRDPSTPRFMTTTPGIRLVASGLPRSAFI